ncbi:MAG: NAD(P)H-hydrate dehydratase [Flavobacteriaceae bacterium]|nr:NAD(P)H-hydrate dehydratase [Flavobacteriaceae bacterium]
MKILSAAQLYEAYNQTIQKQEITALDILERAGTQIFNWMHTRMQGAQVKVHVFNGIGNNGGVGLVLTRRLLEHGYNVDHYVVNYSKKRTEGFLANYDKVKNLKQWPEMIKSNNDFPEIHPDDIIVDAIFGIGLNRETSDYVKQLIQYINQQKAFKLSVDIPSGLYSNKLPLDKEHIIFSNYTLSFQSPKLVFFLPETAKFTEQWEVLDIGLDPEYMYEVEAKANLMAKHNIVPMYQPRKKFSSKFDYGHALLVGGAYGKIGAIHLASKAALVSGAGLVSAFTPKCGYTPLQSSFPEAMVITDEDERIITNIHIDGNYQAIGIGCGMGVDTKTIEAVKTFFKSAKTPLIIDADIFNMMTIDSEVTSLIPEKSILTPHKKELKQLIGEWQDDFEMLRKAKEYSEKQDVVIILKDAVTIVVYHQRMFIIGVGNPALATAGSGDCLTGIITGLIAQGYDPLIGSVFGCYLHGKSADLAVPDTSYQSFIASDIIDYLAEAYLDLFDKGENEQKEEG